MFVDPSVALLMAVPPDMLLDVRPGIEESAGDEPELPQAERITAAAVAAVVPVIR